MKERYQIRVRNRGQGRKIVLHEGWSNYEHAMDRMDELEAQYDRAKFEVEFRDVQLAGAFK